MRLFAGVRVGKYVTGSLASFRNDAVDVVASSAARAQLNRP